MNRSVAIARFLSLMMSSNSIARFLAAFFAAFFCQLGWANHPFISEFVAVGNENVVDEDGDTPDWLEIYNPTDRAIDLDGYHLTDDAGNLTKWTIPSVAIAPGGFLGIFASGKDRANPPLNLHTNFRLSSSGEFLALVAPDGNTILNSYEPEFPTQIPDFSFGIAGDSPEGPQGYFSPPTPVQPNGSINPSPLLTPTITPACATFTNEVEVTLATPFGNGEIRYTTNGNQPTSSSQLYTGPLTFGSSTHLRARVFDPATNEGGATTAGHFQKLASSSNLGGISPPEGFTSNLPIMVVENFGRGSIPGPGQSLQTARVAVFNVDPVTGRSSLSGTPDACFRIGIRRRGQSSAGFAKPQYRVELREEDDSDLDFPLLGLPSESDWVFNGPWTDKSLVRNTFSFDLARAIGNQAPRTRHFEMFLSTNGGDLIASEYVGVYALFESIKLSENRTQLAALTPQDNSDPEVTGGYMMRFEPPGIAGQGPRATGWRSVEIIEPRLPTSAQRNYVGSYFDDFVATLGWSRNSGPNNNGIVNPDPVTGYPAFIDVPSFVNHFIISELGRDQDSYVRSDYMFKDRGGKLHKGPVWDHNLIMGTGCCFDNRNPMGWQYRDNYNRGGRDHSYEPDWFVPLMRDPDFRQKVTDRWSELRRGGPFQRDNLFARLDRQADPLAEAAVRNFAKWNTLGQNGPGFGSPSTQTWEQQIDFIKNWLTARTDWIDLQFPMVPELSEEDGAVIATGDEVSVQSENTIYYTTDGSDPRLPGGEVNPDATALPASLGSVPATFFGPESVWTYLDDGSDQGPSNIVVGNPSYNTSNWKHPDFDDGNWRTGSGVFGFGGIGSPRISFNTTLERRPPSGGDQHRCYYFRKTFEIEDPSDVFTIQANVLRDDGVIIYLNGQEAGRSNIPEGTVLGFEDLTGGPSVPGNVESDYFEVLLDPTLLVEGSNVIAVALHQQTGGSSDLGFDLELVGQVAPGDAPTVDLPGTALVRARSLDSEGEWSGLNEGLFIVGTPAGPSNLIVSEINYHPVAPTTAELAINPSLNNDDFEWIELRNIGPDPIDLSRVTFTDGISVEIATGSTLAPGAYTILVSDPAAFELRYGSGLPIAGTFTGRLNNDGEQIRIADRNDTSIALFTYNDVWYRESDGNGFTLVLRDDSTLPGDYNNFLNWQAGRVEGGTPGTSDPSGNPGFTAWQNDQFSPDQLADESISGPLADPDGDSLTNFLEYGMGLDPNADSSTVLPAAGFVTEDGITYLALSFQRQQGLSEVTFSVETSTDLVNWAPSSIEIDTPIDHGNGTESITMRASVPFDSSTRLQVIRLRLLSN